VSSKVPINPVTTEVSTSQAIACSSQPTLPITTAKRPACTQQINSCLPNTSKRQKLGNPPVLDAVFEGEKSSDPQSFGYVVEMLADVKRCMIGAIE
uniref:Uncharacterized protein n=1 Tax=Anopheles atroparvus TaxID=41427 RepID=A0AAG5DRI6_ANOAO